MAKKKMKTNISEHLFKSMIKLVKDCTREVELDGKMISRCEAMPYYQEQIDSWKNHCDKIDKEIWRKVIFESKNKKPKV